MWCARVAVLLLLLLLVVGGSAASGSSGGVSAAVSAGCGGRGHYKVHLQGVVILEKDMVAVHFISPSTPLAIAIKFIHSCRQAGRQALTCKVDLWYIR